MNIEKLKNYSALLQSILVSMVILSGGFWTLFTLKPHLDAKYLKEQLLPSIQIDMTTKQVELSTELTTKKSLLIEVVTTNTGGQTTEYNFAKNDLVIIEQIPNDKTNSYDNGRIYYGKYMGEVEKPQFGKLAPGGSITYQYAGLVDDPGLYSLLFKAIPAGKIDEKDFYFSSRNLFVVK